MTGVSGAFGKPYAEQLAALRLRFADLRDTAKWTDLWQAEHDRAFMVAGATKADVLNDLAVAIDKAIAQGQTLEWFRKEFRAIVERRGWHGWTGEGTKGGEAWRTRVIYQTNIATSYAAGERAQLTALGYRYWVYRHGNSREPRLQHLAWDGVALPPDHPFWATHSPPNGWGCTCRVRGANSEAGIRRAGGDPAKTLPDGWQVADPKSGAPKGIDKGWAYAPGASVTDAVNALASKPVNWDYSLAVAYMRSVPPANRDAFMTAYREAPSLPGAIGSFADGVRRGVGTRPILTLGLATAKQVDRLRELGFGVASDELFDFVVEPDAVRHVLLRHGDDKMEASRGQVAVKPEDFGLLPEVLNDWARFEVGEVVPGRGQMVTIARDFEGQRVQSVFEIRRGRRRIALVTMWIEKGIGASPTMTP